ncbi:MAG: CocE/NonD family hydrolase [Deltaproteobacteria bacterium]|nr:CocE/NonD family hydrolase [Deltaproteobacteria bacterium]
MPKRIVKMTILISCLVMLYGCSAMKWRAASMALDLPTSSYGVKVEKNVAVEMSDKVKLYGDIYRPSKDGKYPVILLRTPYDKHNKVQKYALMGKVFASHGYIFMVQDVRGRYMSEGEFVPFVNESEDGAETIRWAARQSWSTGRVGMFGLSYHGSTQWLAAVDAPEALKAIVPCETSQDMYRLWVNEGVFKFNQLYLWHYFNEGREEKPDDILSLNDELHGLPLVEADDIAYGNNQIYSEYIRHPVPGEFWRRMSVDDKVQNIRVPALLIAGWNDPFVEAMLDDYNRIKRSGGSEQAKTSRIIIGPWEHNTRTKFKTLDYGKDSRFTRIMIHVLRWYDYWLKSEDNGIMEEDPVLLFVMGQNSWRSEKQWPPERTAYVRYYLRSNGNAGDEAEGGKLSVTEPGVERFDTYIYDPANPVPTIGGEAVYENMLPGPADQRSIEQRPDVLVYTSEPLHNDMEITGNVSLVLYASSSGVDTDFVARLCDVYPDGRSIGLTTGIVRARYRASLESPELLENDTVYHFEINVGATSNVFKKGHRLRLHVTSSDFPRFDRNLNTGDETGITSKMIKASQRIYHDTGQASYLVLPVIPE